MIDVPEIMEPKTAYVANIRALWENWSELAYQVDQVDELDFVACEPSRRGAMTCQMRGIKGEMVYVHSKYDPEREADKWAQGVEGQAKQQEDFENGRVPMCYVVDGFGLGYHVKALFDKLTGDAFVVVIERNLAMLRTALELHDYSEMLGSRRLIVITKSDRDEIFDKLQAVGNLMMMGTVFTRSLSRIDHEFYGAVHQLVGEYASFLRSHLSSLLANSIVTCENVLYNLPTYVGTAGIDALKNRFAGHPAVLVAAGPSLRKNLPLLKEIRDRVVLISVQTTLKPLLNYGIVPDFVTSLDYHHVSKRFFEGLEDLGDIQLVAEPKANWQVVDYYRGRGPLSLLGNDFARLVLKGAEDAHDNLPAGATVAHLSFYLAEYLGADQIILIGQDLAFTDNVYYSPGTALHTVWRPEFNRFCTVEMKEWERIARHRNILRKVKDIHGQEIYTDEQMFTYMQQFEKDFSRCSVRVVDATGGGASKQGCETMSLAEAVEQFCQRPIDQGKFGYRQETPLFDGSALSESLERVRERIEDVEGMKAIMDETIELVKEMLALIDDQGAVNKKMVRLDELRTMVKHRNDTYRLIMHVAQDAELYRFRQDRALGVDDVQGKARQRRQLQRDVAYVGQLRKGCVRLLGMLNDCVGRFEKEIAAHEGQEGESS